MSRIPVTREPDKPLQRWVRRLPGCAELEADFARLLGAVLIAATGIGATLPYFQIYLNEALGYDLALTGTASAVLALAGIPVIVLGGPAADRWGARRLLLVTAVICVTGSLLMTAVAAAPLLFLAVAVLGAGLGLQLPMIGTLIGDLRPRQGQAWAFAAEYLVLNVGLAAGSVAGGLVVASRQPAAFQAVYVVEAACFAGTAALVSRIGRRASAAPVAADPDGTSAAAGGYRPLLADVRFLLAGLTVLMVVVAGYAQLQSVLPLYLSRAAHLSTAVIGLAFAANTACVIGLQMPVRRLFAHASIPRLLFLLAAAWTASWLALLVAGALRPGPILTAGLAAVALGVIGTGETLYSMGVPALVNQIAPDALRGRYNAGSALCWQAGMVVGPLAGDLALASGGPAAYPLFGGVLSALIVPVALALRVALDRWQPVVAPTRA